MQMLKASETDWPGEIIELRQDVVPGRMHGAPSQWVRPTRSARHHAATEKLACEGHLCVKSLDVTSYCDWLVLQAN